MNEYEEPTVIIIDKEGNIFDAPVIEHEGIKVYALTDILGEGKGKGGHTPYEYPNTLRTIENALSLIAIGEGPIQSFNHIYLNDTDIDAFPDVGYECRLGESAQSTIPGFSNVMAASSVSTQLVYNNGIARDVSSATVDALLVTISLDTLFQVIDFGGMDGDIYGYGVDFLFDYRTSKTAGWVNAFRINIQGKTMTPYSQGFVIGAPAGAGIWGVRVTRVTRDDPTVKFSSVSRWSTKTEITYKDLPYNNTALVGMMADAKSTGGSVPTYSFEVNGLKVLVPSNYVPSTRTYYGLWNGTFATALQYTTNPAFILLDLLINTRYGMGVPVSSIDTFSFYNAATYSDQLVSYKNENGITESLPRFSFNGILQTRENAYQLIQAMASSMRAYVIDLHGLLTCIQDRPTTPNRIFTNANVIDGIFEYNSNQLNERYTQVNVTWNDPADRFKQRITTVPFASDHTYAREIAKYPYNPIDLAAMGTTNEGQAYRLGRYYLDNALMTPENVQFKAGIENAYLAPGEVVYVTDDHYAGRAMGGRIVSATTTSIVIDRTINVNGIGTIMVYNALGVIMTGNISGSGLMSTINLTTALPSAPAHNSAYIINLSTLSPRPFRISKISLLTGDALGQIEISGSFYDINKFARVDGTAIAPPPIFTDPGLYSSAKPINISAKVIQVTDNTNKNSWVNLLINWDPGDDNAYTYKMKWSNEAKPFIEVNDICVSEYQIDHAQQGLYDIRLYAINSAGAISPEAEYRYTYGHSNIPGAPGPGGSNPSGLLPMTQFFVKGTGGVTFTGKDLIVTWIDPNTTGPNKPVVSKYAIKVFKVNKVTIIREYIIDKESVHEFDYWYSMNIKDFTDPSRTVYMEVYGVDAQNRYSPPCGSLFVNPAPIAPSFTVISGTEVVWVNIHLNTKDEDDFLGFQICRSPTANFVKGSGTLVYDGPDSVAQLNIPNKVLYWYSCAAYDSFGKTGLNWASEQSSMPLSLEAINFTWTGHVTCNTPVLKTLYWSAGWVVRDGVSFQITAGSKLWSVGTLYLYWDPSISTTKLQTTTTLGIAVQQGCYPIATYTGGNNTTLKGGDGLAFISGSSIIAGTVGAAQLIAGSAVITGTAQIANAIINNAHIQDAAITNAKISGAIQSSDYNTSAHTGWQANKAGDITTYGSLQIYDNAGNPVLTTGGIADAQWKKLTSSGNVAPNFDRWTKTAGAWVLKNEPWSEDDSALIIPTNQTGYTYITAGNRLYGGNWYTVSFKAYCEKGTRNLAIDFYPDVLPEKHFVITTSPTVYTWTFILNPAANVPNCLCRIWDFASSGWQMHIMDFQVELGALYTPWKMCNDNYINWLNTLSPENIGVFMPRAAIGTAQIMNASINTLMLQGNVVTVPAAITTGRTGHIPYNSWFGINDVAIGGQEVSYPCLLTFGGVYGSAVFPQNGNLQARILQNGNQVWYAVVGSGSSPAGSWCGSTIVWVPANTYVTFHLDYSSGGWTSLATENNFINAVACKR